MRIAGIHIDGFGKLRDFDLKLEDGMNVITGANEAGKSTLHIFFKSMFYGADTVKRAGARSDYERMRPWIKPQVYGGSMDVFHGGGLYRISRDFSKAADNIKITSLYGGGPVKDPAKFMDGLLKGLGSSAYMNTVSVGQLKTGTDRSISQEIVRYASNMSTAANPGLSAEKALKYLEDKKEKLKSALKPDAARDYNRLLSRQDALQKAVADPARGNCINKYVEACGTAEKDSDELSVELAQNELVISEWSEELNRRGLDNMDDVERLKNSAESLERDYESKRKSVPVYIVLGLMGLIAGALGLSANVYDIFGLAHFFEGKEQAVAVVSLALILFGAMMLVIAVFYGARKNRDYAGLISLAAAHVNMAGGQSLETSMGLLREKIDSYRADAAKLGVAREERARLMERLRTLNRSKSQYLTELENQRRIKEGVENDLKELGSIKRQLVALERAINENKKLYDSIEACDMAMDTIRQLSEDIKASAGTYINDEAGKMLAGVTGGAYLSMDAGRGGIRVNSKRGLLPLEDMSLGTCDQIYLALRIASARFLTGGGDEVPLILDDSFVLYDEERLKGALKFLHENFKGQLIIFTCQQREEAALSAESIPHLSISI